MEDTAVAFEDAVDTRGGEGVPELGIAPKAEDSNPDEALQERMAGDPKADPWFSDSEGKVVDPNGEVLINPETQEPFRSMQEYEAAKKKLGQSPTAKPKTDAFSAAQQPGQQKSDSKSFDQLVAPDGKLTPERLFALSKAASEFQYKDDLAPEIDPKLVAGDQAPKDPVEAVRERRQIFESHLITPLQKIRDALIAAGVGDASVVDAFMAPHIKEQQAKIETDYQQQYERALEERLDGKYAAKLSATEEKDLRATSKANLDRICNTLYGQGVDSQAIFALINGHVDDKGQFVRGPAANFFDFVHALDTGGKKFGTKEDMNASRLNSFLKITANPKMAAVFADIAHHYWIGRQQYALQKSTYEKGKAAATQAQSTARRTVRTPPASFGAPPNAERSSSPFVHALGLD